MVEKSTAPIRWKVRVADSEICDFLLIIDVECTFRGAFGNFRHIQHIDLRACTFDDQTYSLRKRWSSSWTRSPPFPWQSLFPVLPLCVSPCKSLSLCLSLTGSLSFFPFSFSLSVSASPCSYSHSFPDGFYQVGCWPFSLATVCGETTILFCKVSHLV